MKRDQAAQKLIIQSQGGETVMVLAGEAPVLHVRTPLGFDPEGRFEYLDEWMRKLIVAMDFIRAGAPEVTLYSDYLLRCEQRGDRVGFDRIGKALNKALRVFGDGESSFEADVDHGGGVLHITRRVYEKD